MNRMDALTRIVRDPHYGPKIKKLSLQDRSLIHSFIEFTFHDSSEVFSDKVKNLFLNHPNKPKEWGAIEEVLMAVNGVANDVQKN